jgi:hypothetical protein
MYIPFYVYTLPYNMCYTCNAPSHIIHIVHTQIYLHACIYTHIYIRVVYTVCFTLEQHSLFWLNVQIAVMLLAVHTFSSGSAAEQSTASLLSRIIHYNRVTLDKTNLQCLTAIAVCCCFTISTYSTVHNVLLYDTAFMC